MNRFSRPLLLRPGAGHRGPGLFRRAPEAFLARQLRRRAVRHVGALVTAIAIAAIARATERLRQGPRILHRRHRARR